MSDTIEVYHAGNPDRGIEGTGQERVMGKEQFERVKQNGWKAKPSTKGKTQNKAKPETAKDSDKEDSAPNGVLAGNVNQVVTHIKELAADDKLDTVKALLEEEKASKDPRSTVIKAAEKVLL